MEVDMSNKLIKIGITQGDTNGVSYELIIKTFAAEEIFELCIPVLYGSSKVLAYHRKEMALPSLNINVISHADQAKTDYLNLVNCGCEEVTVDFGKATPESESAAVQSMQMAFDDLKAGMIDALVFAPSNVDERQFLSQQSGKMPMKTVIHNNLRIAFADQLTTDSLVCKIKDLHTSLIHDFAVTFPRIAVLSFNRGKGIKEREEGREEADIIIPAIKAACEKGIICVGPYAINNFFSDRDYMKFSAVLAITHHGQVLMPFRSISSGEGACYYAGIPFVATAPDYDAAHGNAGKNESSEAAFRNAFYLALDVFRTRKIDKEIHANPLKKHYFENGLDNEKLDLTKEY
jgi:4-hydroxythreonine-4-phosphate dehydrogenase